MCPDGELVQQTTGETEMEKFVTHRPGGESQPPGGAPQEVQEECRPTEVGPGAQVYVRVPEWRVLGFRG